MVSHCDPALVVRPVPGVGAGVFTIAAIPAGQVVVAWGGEVVHRDHFLTLPVLRQTHSLQIDDDLYLLATPDLEPADLVNHSCDPSCGLFGATMLVTRRDLTPGEEITFDYAMTDASDYDEFLCSCGTTSCRGVVSGVDWRRPELWERYDGQFSPYLQRRIARMRHHTLTGSAPNG